MNDVSSLVLSQFLQSIAECLNWESLTTAGPLKQTEGGRGDINIARHCGMRDRSYHCLSTSAHVCAVCVFACMCVRVHVYVVLTN